MKTLTHKLLAFTCLISSVSFAQTILVTDNFDDANITGWTENSNGNWAASNSNPIKGTHSLKHVPAVSGESYIYQQVTTDPSKGDMVWQWTWKPSFDPTQANTFWFSLLSDNANLSLGNGYALGFNMNSAYDDVLKFYKTTAGTSDAYGELLNFGTAYDINQDDIWAFKVTRNSLGFWDIYIDKAGGTSYTKLGSTYDNTFKPVNPYTGIYFKHTSSTGASKLRIDDILVTTTQGEATPVINLSTFKTKVREGQEITINAIATSAVNASKTLTFNYGGTASASDYTASATTITIPAGSTKGSATITIKADTEFEETENLNITLGLNGQTGVSIGNGVNLSIFDDVRIMHYNLLRYPDCLAPNSPAGCNATIKNGYLKTIFNYLQPDIIGVNEMDADDANNITLLNGALNVNGVTKWKKAAFDHPTASDISNMLFYNSDKFTLYSQEAITVSGQRETNLYTLYLNYPELATTQDTIFINVIQTHLKAGSGVIGQPGGNPQNLLDRDEIAKAIMARINQKNPDGKANYIVMGDFNLYTSTEPAYETFTNYTTNPSISFIDPINTPGVWSADEAFAHTHTQATRFSSAALGDNGGSGGMDDRFDFILASNSVISGSDSIQYISDTYNAVGQDGQRFQKDLNSKYNSTTPQEVMDALFYNSDHLPVTADFKFKFKNEVTKFIADKTEACGAPAIINFTDQSTNSPSDWLWDFGDGTTSNLQNPSHAYNTTGKFNVKLTVTKGAGGTDQAIINNYITVYGVTTTANAGSEIKLCNKTNTTLAGNSPLIGSGVWSLVSGTATITNPTSFNSTVTGLALNTPTVLKWTISNGTCTASTSNVTVTNFTNPDATITNVKSVCVSDVLNLTSATNGGTWSGTAVNNSTKQFNATTAGVGTHAIAYTVTDANNCTSNANANLVVRTKFDATITTANTTILKSDPAITFTATDDGGVWGGSTGINATTGVLNPAAAAEGANIITYTFTGNCAATANHTITVFNSTGFDDFSDGNFTASPVWSGSTASYIVNSNKELQLDDKSGATAVTYLSAPNTIMDDAIWQFNFKHNGGLSGSNLAEVYLVSDGSDLTANLNGYFLRIGNTNDEVSLFKKTGSSNSTLINGTDKLIAQNNVNVSIKVTRSKTGNWALFVDTAGGSNFIADGTASDNTHTTTAFFGVVNKFTKTNSQAASFDNFVITGDASPFICPTITSDFTFTVDSGKVNFSNKSTNATSYSWDFGNGANATSTSPSNIYTAKGTYNVCLTANIQCATAVVTCKDVTITVVTGIETVNTLNSTIFPNPASSNTTIQVDEVGLKTIRIYNNIGKLVLTKNSNSTSTNVDVNHFANGVYSVVIETNDKKSITKLVVVK